MSTDSDELQIGRHKRLLQEIREEDTRDGRYQSNDGQFSSGRYASSGEGSHREGETGDQGLAPGNSGGAERASERAGADEGYHQGIRPSGRTTEHSDTSLDQSGRRVEASLVPEETLTPEQKAEREREQTRQRVQRYRDKQKVEREEGTTQAQNVTLRYSVTDEKDDESLRSRNAKETIGNGFTSFRLKMPFGNKEPEKVKLFTIKESEDEEILKKMTRVYFQGSKLLDDILEIIVKDHEEVQIWQLSEEEAEMLAQIHLERAKHDQASARSARKLLEIHDRLYFYLIILPRLKATGKHISKHRGFSFR